MRTWYIGCVAASRTAGVMLGCGNVRLFLGDRELAYGTLRTEPRPQRQRVQSRGRPTKSIQGLKPAKTLPWRGRGQPSSPTPVDATFGVGVGCSAPVAALRNTPPLRYVKKNPKGTFLMVDDRPS